MAAIARNEALRLASRAAGRRELPTDPFDLGRASPPAPEGPEPGRPGYDAIVRLLGRGDGEILELRYVHDLTHEQIAQRLGMPAGTIKARLHRFRLRARAFMAERERPSTPK